LINSAITGRIG